MVTPAPGTVGSADSRDAAGGRSGRMPRSARRKQLLAAAREIFVAQGYYDMATVMGGMEFNFAHLGYDKTFTDRVSFGYYEAGHMIYIRPSAHKAMKQDVAKFFEGTRTVHTPDRGEPG